MVGKGRVSGVSRLGGETAMAVYIQRAWRASLRTTQLTRDQIRMTIQCGRPGTPMPHFDRFAYTDKRCYDMTAQDLGDSVPDRAAVTLQSYEIDALADYIAAKIKGAGPITQRRVH